jgi:hypothetical protein
VVVECGWFVGELFMVLMAENHSYSESSLVLLITSCSCTAWTCTSEEQAYNVPLHPLQVTSLAPLAPLRSKIPQIRPTERSIRLYECRWNHACLDAAVLHSPSINICYFSHRRSVKNSRALNNDLRNPFIEKEEAQLTGSPVFVRTRG